ncbi:hypothetical protein BWQ96_01787 [Gracilariopsis chorda]|uniref:Uncharacterized protein n=1 Tax=Gracilariopsis chorda TaxID=448386 RepID=A0A2V3J2V8_9FLOR|nr:hypothetical protein BWQ96_01787 [Gracilariopsis chorda]|eukprot:PXF48327.1 hypothetical protein BWQ96_01787 [Gracilariopsis chorda]
MQSDSAPSAAAAAAQTHLSSMFTALISSLDRASRENLCHVLHHCHTRLSPRTHLPVMFFNERDEITYQTAYPYLNHQPVPPQRPSRAWDQAHRTALHYLQLVHASTQPAKPIRNVAPPRPQHTPPEQHHQLHPVEELSNDFDDDSYISDSDMSYVSHMSDVTYESSQTVQSHPKCLPSYSNHYELQSSQKHL